MTWGKQSEWDTTQTRGRKAFKATMIWCLSLHSWIYKLITNGKHSGKQISHYKSPQFESNHVKRHEKVVQEMVPIHVYHFLKALWAFLSCAFITLFLTNPPHANSKKLLHGLASRFMLLKSEAEARMHSLDMHTSPFLPYACRVRCPCWGVSWTRPRMIAPLKRESKLILEQLIVSQFKNGK